MVWRQVGWVFQVQRVFRLRVLQGEDVFRVSMFRHHRARVFVSYVICGPAEAEARVYVSQCVFVSQFIRAPPKRGRLPVRRAYVYKPVRTREVGRATRGGNGGDGLGGPCPDPSYSLNTTRIY